MAVNKCDTCLHVHKVEQHGVAEIGKTTDLECHAHPPTPFLLVGPQGQTAVRASYPPVKHGCGEWMPRTVN